MKLKSLLLGSVAALSLGAMASAADLPSAKPVTGVCDSFGAGFIALPGSDTCLKIGGWARADTLIHANNAGAARWDGAKDIPFVAPGALEATTNDTYATRTRFQLDFDARTKTEYGPLRAFLRVRTDTRSDTATPNTITNNFVSPYYAFVQFAGVTAGLAQSNFDFLNYSYYDSLSAGYAHSDRQINQLAYTYTAAGGYFATIALEDANFSDNTIVNNVGILNVANGRNDMPDVVVSVGAKQGWGDAQLSGAVGKTSYSSGTGNNLGTNDEVRWAVRGGLAVKLDQLAKGDVLAITAAYSEGNTRYLGLGVDDAGYVLRLATGGTGWNMQAVKGYAVSGGIKHYWMPNLRSTLAANYVGLDWGNGVKTTSVGGATASYTENLLLAQANLIYTPVKNLDLGVEVLYGKREGFTKTSNTVAASRDADTFGAIFRVQRSF